MKAHLQFAQATLISKIAKELSSSAEQKIPIKKN